MSARNRRLKWRVVGIAALVLVAVAAVVWGVTHAKADATETDTKQAEEETIAEETQEESAIPVEGADSQS